MSRNRQKIITGILSLVDAGLGHIYNGKIKLGLILYFSFQLLNILLYFVGLSSFTALITAVSLLILYRAGIIIHSVYLAGQPVSKTNSFYRKGAFIIAFMILSLIFNVSITWMMKSMMYYDTRKAASENMDPTLQKGDFIVIDKGFYTDTAPARDRLVVYHPPNNPLHTSIGRVIGVPGDVVECNNGNVTRNNSIVDEKYINHDRGINFKKLTVPDNSYFILGDNRADSFDSRHFGFVNRDAIYGKPLYIYYSSDFSRIGNELE